MRRPPRLLAVSNGHGEDDIAVKVLEALARRRKIDIDAWAVVGAGDAYRARDIPLTGPGSHMPSEGFGTLSLKMFWRDLRGGFLATSWRQLRHAAAIRGRYDLLLGVGDVVPLLAAWASATPMAFVACAKSAYYVELDGHTPLERRLMRRRCAAVFPRDQRTADGFAARSVPCQYLGNPMMDGLGESDDIWPLEGDQVGVVMLAGSRQDATENALFLLDAAGRLAERAGPQMRFLFPVHPSVDLARLDGAPGWRRSDGQAALTLAHTGGARAEFEQGRLGAMLRSGTVAVGLAGTANEQAIGLGLPLITLPGLGNQGDAYVRMKMAYFGEAAVAVPRNPERVAEELGRLMADPDRQLRMRSAGRERMGHPGASDAIAEWMDGWFEENGFGGGDVV
ncbi:MAG: lipid-A-disaccharide synthase-related protein [Pseudomonadota bacterium]